LNGVLKTDKTRLWNSDGGQYHQYQQNE